MKRYKYIHIKQRMVGLRGPQAELGETFNDKPVYGVYNNRSKDQIGIISWYKQWKEYVFSSQPECVFNNSCLRDIVDFIENHVAK